MKYVAILMIAFATMLILCKPGTGSGSNTKEEDSLAIRKAYSSSPVLTPEKSLEKMRVEQGFTVKLVASEPLIAAPVALTFDQKGRIWVLEMEGYMPDTVGTGESRPAGKVVILEDKNKDGVADSSKLIIDSLVMPRAICLVENGVLIAEPPKLWYFTIKDDKVIKKTLVDSLYTEGGNVEHQPNGLYRDMDNWIYSANSEKRYRKKGDQWLVQRTIARGQWGISQDDYGRLFYNNNSENLLGDYFSPAFGATNSNQRRIAGFNEKIVGSNRVYPSRPTTGVNRGYTKGVLDDSLRLVNFTAASGPVIYRGGLFGADFNGNAFVGEPSANLIKRNILENNGYRVSGKQAYKGKEFISSQDERFRPVTIYNGPDGALYIVDMYRGIIQHKTYLTEYLKSEIKARNLTNPLTCGRIYKVLPEGKAPGFVTIPDDPKELVKLLNSSNGWLRDRAQQLLIDGKFKEVIPALQQNLRQTTNPLTVIHSLWTLEGLGALRPADLMPLLKKTSWPLRMQALNASSSVLSPSTYRQFIPLLEQMLADKDTLAAPYIAFLLQTIQGFDKRAANHLSEAVVELYPRNIFVADAVISNLKGREDAFLKELAKTDPDTSIAIYSRLKKVLTDIRNAKNNKNAKLLAKELPKGVALFKSTCQTCHGPDGDGIKALAPPLNGSDWVKGDKDKLIPIVLYGLTGPVEVTGMLYAPPEINGDMPAIGFNAELTDEDIAQVISFIRNSWNNNGEKVSAADITRVRQKFKGRQKAFTMEELRKMK